MDACSSKSVRRWTVAFLWGISIFLLILYYHYVRRGEINPFASTIYLDPLYLANKAFASGSVVMIAISLFLGPLARFFPWLSSCVCYRKEIGLMGFFMAVVHTYISLFLLEAWFPYDWYLTNRLAVMMGYLALVLFLVISITSLDKIAFKLGYKRWKFIQRLAYLGLFFVVLHIIFQKKTYSSWLQWFQTFDPVLPPASLVISIIILVVFVMRVAVFLLDSRKGPKSYSEKKSL
tara:strand:+ start:207 stop:908 length:702 start_codon:yes stop_codon:yes gene_type:complete